VFLPLTTRQLPCPAVFRRPRRAQAAIALLQELAEQERKRSVWRKQKQRLRDEEKRDLEERLVAQRRGASQSLVSPELVRPTTLQQPLGAWAQQLTSVHYQHVQASQSEQALMPQLLGQPLMSPMMVLPALGQGLRSPATPLTGPFAPTFSGYGPLPSGTGSSANTAMPNQQPTSVCSSRTASPTPEDDFDASQAPEDEPANAKEKSSSTAQCQISPCLPSMLSVPLPQQEQQEQPEQPEQQRDMGTTIQREPPRDATTATTAPYCKVYSFGATDGAFPPEAPALLLQAFERIWAAAEKYGIDAIGNTGKLRGKSVKEMKSQHETMARSHLGWDGKAALPCGGLHGGWSAMAGGSEKQSWRFLDQEGCEHQAPYFWKLEDAMTKHDPKLHEFVSALQYAMEYSLLQAHPELWLRSYESFGDLDAHSPGPGRLYRDGMYNQWVLNRNLMLSPHTDHLNIDKARSHPLLLPCHTQHSIVSPPPNRVSRR